MTEITTGWRSLVGLGAAFLILPSLPGCDPPNPQRVQGYVEGEFVYVGSALAGTLEALHVERGTQVEAGHSLFTLDSTPEKAARDEAERKLAMGRANWEDLKKGKRPSEIDSLEAQLKQARSALAFSETELGRQVRLAPSGAAAVQDFDRARSTRDQDRQRVSQLEADLQTARLGARSDQIAGAEANVRALEATLTNAEWCLSQKHQRAPQAGLVFDTLFREGEWVAAGRPVVALLPPQNIKVRAFVPEAQVGAVHTGDAVRVVVDGVERPFLGRVSFISPKAEFTPPVIYSRESRSKLVFMLEVRFDPDVAAQLHPGQPVDVRLGP